MNAITYHRDIYLPIHILNRIHYGPFLVRYSKHAEIAAKQDRYGNVPLPGVVDFSSRNIVEVTLKGNSIEKFVVRLPIDNIHDACYVFMVDGNSLFCKTCWANRFDDTHKTLKSENYIPKPA